MNRNIGPLKDGDDDPLADDMGPGTLTRRRRETIHALLQMMGCNHPRNINCDCVDAISELGRIMVETTISLMMDAIRELPRPLKYRDISDLVEHVEFVTMLSTSTERRNS